MGRITSFSKQVIVFFLVTALIIRPTFAANVGGWTMSNPVAQGASTVYEGTKNVIINGADYIKKGTAKITPTASQVAKVLRGGVAGYALSIAVEQLIGSVDWVLDPANNAIKYYSEVSDCESTGCPASSKVFYVYGDDRKSHYFTSLATGCAYVATLNYSKDYTLISFNMANPENGNCYFHSKIRPDLRNWDRYTQMPYVSNPAYNPNAERQEKSIPLETVAQKVISNAQGGDQNAQVATMAAAADIVDEAANDESKARPIVDQLNNSSSTSPANSDANANANIGSGSVANPNTADPDAPPLDLTLKFPIFCNWAPSVCEAAQVVISFPQTLTDWWNIGKSKAEEWATAISETWTKVKEEYADKPEENTDTELDIPDLSDETIDTDISFNGYCPAPLSSDINFMGLNKTIEFSFDPVCQIAEFIKPVVISISAFSAALIVAGIRTEDD